jgi:hypothetical protein
MKKTQKEIENCLVSDLSNLISEFDNKTLTEEGIYNYFRNFMQDADVDSKITVNVLEQFGKSGKEEARSIKIEEGW